MEARRPLRAASDEDSACTILTFCLASSPNSLIWLNASFRTPSTAPRRESARVHASTVGEWSVHACPPSKYEDAFYSPYTVQHLATGSRNSW